MKEPRHARDETRILDQYWKLGTASVREALESLRQDERVAYTTVQTLVYRLEEKGALKKVKKIGNAQLFQPALDQSQYRSRLVGTCSICSAARRDCLFLTCSRMEPLPYGT